MQCVKHNYPMVQLLTSWACDVCDGIVTQKPAEKAIDEGEIAFTQAIQTSSIAPLLAGISTTPYHKQPANTRSPIFQWNEAVHTSQVPNGYVRRVLGVEFFSPGIPGFIHHLGTLKFCRDTLQNLGLLPYPDSYVGLKLAVSRPASQISTVIETITYNVVGAFVYDDYNKKYRLMPHNIPTPTAYQATYYVKTLNFSPGGLPLDGGEYAWFEE